MKTYVLIAVLLSICTFGLPGAALSEDSWEVLIKRGKDALNDGRKQDAERAYKQALSQAEALGEDDPRLTGSLYLLAELYTRHLDEPLVAIKYLQRQQAILRKLGPDFMGLCDSMDLLGQDYKALGRYEEAEKCYLFALKIMPTGWALTNKDRYLDLHKALGECYYQWGKYSDAERVLRAGILYGTKTLVGDFTKYCLYNDLGDVYRQTGRGEKAIAAYLNSLKILGQNPDWHDRQSEGPWHVGLAYDVVGNFDQELEWLRLAIRKGNLYPSDNWPDLMDSYYRIAIIENRRHHRQEALHCARQAATIADKHPNSAAAEIKNFLAGLEKER